jgi:glucose/arabinose dehydrogenase
MRYVVIAFVIIAIAGLAVYATLSRDRLPQTPSPWEFQPVASKLQTPWALAFAPDGRLFITERPGRIRVVDHDKLLPEPWATIAVYDRTSKGYETGLLGLAIDPAFAESHRVYVCFTQPAPSDSPTSNVIAVLTENGGRGTTLKVLLTGMVAGPYHNGCRLKFGPDGKLYATMGDAAPGGERSSGGRAQSVQSLNGKILRLNPDGSIPKDNPFPHSYVWSYGHRNPQGLAFQPETGRLFETEHGAGSGGSGNNELNIIEAGKNYGWPAVGGKESHDGFAAPLVVYDDNPPAGATFVTSDRYPSLKGNLLIGTLGSQRLLSVVFMPEDPSQVLRTDVLIEKTFGRIRDVVEGPDGYLYFSTSNRDGRNGKGRSGDDHVFRLVPATTPTR